MTEPSPDTHPDTSKWNRRYQSRDATPEPCRLLQEHPFLLPVAGVALDLACGLGGNSLFLAERGLQVHAWDISSVALEKLGAAAGARGLQVIPEIRDLEASPPPAASFDCIVVSYYLDRALCPAISAALKPGGLLFYQTFTRNKLSDSGPSSEQFLLKNNELLTLFNNLEVRFYREYDRCGHLESGDRDTAQLIARKPAT